MNNYLITIIGPTAIGKTAMSIKVAKHFNTEIISSDSRQFYKEMIIGTAVPNADELNAVKHHFIQNLSIHNDYSVGQFEKDAIGKLNELFEKHNCVVLVGGSGLYVDAVLKGLDDFPKVDPSIRENLKSQLKENGIIPLQKQLKKLDVESYEKIDIENHQRLIRALEICIGTDKPYSSFLTDKTTQRNFIPVKIGLTADREIIYDRINQRVDIMVDNGLLDEAKKLFKNKKLNALQTVGYKELFSFLNNETSFDFAIEEIKKNTRRFAKRQLTWFRKDDEIQWFNFQDPSQLLIEYIHENIVNSIFN
ncbi:MAG: tRNA (adenosine(37)-N6)-dimethylallyltransferase MiaA [Flavobacteriaceae bacterium]|nr:tRNA (adenosine(37)-N6)-dimethylallyltransferase MiaA [Flavobacteriaceae bacterium]